jgi:hypothetical protein
LVISSNYLIIVLQQIRSQVLGSSHDTDKHMPITESEQEVGSFLTVSPRQL